jgi:hypothetical protein
LDALAPAGEVITQLVNFEARPTRANRAPSDVPSVQAAFFAADAGLRFVMKTPPRIRTMPIQVKNG